VGLTESASHGRIQDVPDHRAIRERGNDPSYHVSGRAIAKDEVISLTSNSTDETHDSPCGSCDISCGSRTFQEPRCGEILPSHRARQRFEDVLDEVSLEDEAFGYSFYSLAHDAGAREQNCSLDLVRVEKFQDVQDRPARPPVPRGVIDEENIYRSAQDGSGGNLARHDIDRR